MKRSKYMVMTVVAILLTTMLTACIEKSEVTFYGVVKASPTTISNGEEIVLTVKQSIYAETTINGENPIKSVSYFIDGEYIAESRDKDNEYSVTYTVHDSSSGTHTVSARCNPRSGNCKINGGITDCVITVK